MGVVRNFFLIVFLLGFYQGVGADSSDRVEYSKSGVQFEMLKGWEVTEDGTEAGVRTIFAESEDSLIVISIFSAEDDMALDDYIEIVIEEMKNNMPMGSRDTGEFSDVSRMIAGVENAGRQNTFDISAFGIKLPFTTHYYKIPHAGGAVVFTVQIADEDLADEKAGVDVFFDSFVYE